MYQPRKSRRDHRNGDVAAPALLLLDLDPALAVDGDRLDAYAIEEVSSCGVMREICPVCDKAHLQLVLRQKNVRISHLYCSNCGRCFDACFPDGSSALA